MGVTKILSIRHQLSARLDYVTNSEKTHLATDITYITNPEKTEQSFFVSVINCLTPESVYDEMMNTKIRFGKTDGVQGFISSNPLHQGRSHRNRPTALAWSFASGFWATALKL